MTTIEGMIDRIKTNLESDIKLRKDVDKETADKLQEFVDKLDDLKKFKLGEFEIVNYFFVFVDEKFLFRRFQYIEIVEEI